MSNPQPLRDQRILITGGGTGIGRGIARRLAAHGALVAVSGRREALLQETAAAVQADGGVCEVQVMDVTDREGAHGAVGQLAERMGGLTGLVNNAGVGGPNRCGGEGPDRWQTILSTNLDGLYFCTEAAVPLLPDGGRVIHISSVLGKFGVPGYTGYATSKHGVIGFTKSLALELAPRKITVNAICPGWVETVMAHEGFEGIATAMGVSPEEARREALSQVPLGEIVTPEEIGDLAVYLCSPAARNMTGQAISLCGGSTMG